MLVLISNIIDNESQGEDITAIQTAFKTRTRTLSCGDMPPSWLQRLNAALAKRYKLKVRQPTTPHATYRSNICCNTYSNHQAPVDDIPTCTKYTTQTCIKHMEPLHLVKTCDQGEDRQRMLKLAGQKKRTPCLSCGLIAEKVLGCRRMRCARCKVECSYMCGRT